jgi:tetratricopeptide (TPR) repeat protein
MQKRAIFGVLILGASMTAQSAPAPCPADRPVDEIIAAIQKQQSKKAARNKSPLPDNLCIIGWCRQTAKTPPMIPGEAARAEAGTGDASTSKPKLDRCDEAMERTLEAAHDIEVGDFYFEEKNYKAAAMRYKTGLKNKPDDAAIHVRLGRTHEKLKDSTQALEHYQAADRLGTPEKWAQEAREALARLRR